MSIDIEAKVDLVELYEMLECHDWFHFFDHPDSASYRAGADFQKQIMDKANQSTEGKRLFKEYQQYKYNARLGREDKKFPKPGRPEK
jgi:hypothetical protein